MQGIGRVMQRIGLFVPLLAIVLQLAESVTLGQMLAMLGMSICLFWIGRIVEGYAKS